MLITQQIRQEAEKSSFCYLLRSKWCLGDIFLSHEAVILSFTSISSSAIRKSVLGAVFREVKQQRRRRLRKRHLKSGLALLQTLSRLFHVVQFVKCWPYFLELSSTRLYCSGKEKESRCLELRVSNKFFGMRISLIWGLGSGILKGNRCEIRDWKYAREVGCQK